MLNVSGQDHCVCVGQQQCGGGDGADGLSRSRRSPRRLLAASSYPMSVSMDTFCCLCAAAWLRGLNGLIERSRRRPGMHGNLVLSSTAVHVHVHCMLDSRSAQQSESIIR